MASCLKLFQFTEGSSRTASWSRRCSGIISALFSNAFPDKDPTIFHSRSSGGSLDLSGCALKPTLNEYWFVKCCTSITVPYSSSSFQDARAKPVRSVRLGLQWLQHDHKIVENCRDGTRNTQYARHSRQQLNLDNSLVWDLLSYLSIVSKMK